MYTSGTHCTGVILAAGRGTRINPLSLIIPKPLLPVCNKPVMQYQIEAMRDAGIREMIVVVGHLGDRIQARFGDGSHLGVRMRYVVDENPQGIASSLALVEPHVVDRCIVFLGDIFLAFEESGWYLNLMERPGVQAVLFVKRERDPEAIKRNFAVILGEAGRVMQVIEKPKVLHNDLKGCGVYVFDGAIFDAIRQSPRSSLRNEYELTDAIQVLIDMGCHVRAADTVRFDINVTFPLDLLRCNLIWLREQGLRSLCGRQVRLAPGTILDEAVLGDSVQVNRPMTIRQSVVFPHTQVTSPSGIIERSIVLSNACLSF